MSGPVDSLRADDDVAKDRLGAIRLSHDDQRVRERAPRNQRELVVVAEDAFMHLRCARQLALGFFHATLRGPESAEQQRGSRKAPRFIFSGVSQACLEHQRGGFVEPVLVAKNVRQLHLRVEQVLLSGAVAPRSSISREARASALRAVELALGERAGVARLSITFARSSGAVLASFFRSCSPPGRVFAAVANSPSPR